LLYNTCSPTFSKSQTSYLEYKLKFHFGQGSIIIKLQTIFLRQSGYCLDIFLAFYLHEPSITFVIELI
jgi:O-acetylhomoserine/O-acetylserine sulfhydrylase-like pyridoxal-dependent enzyme